MIHPFVTDPVNIDLGPKRIRIQFIFGPLIDNTPEHPVNGSAISLRFNEVLLKGGAENLHQHPASTNQGEISPYGVLLLEHVVYTKPDKA